jgi:hypothetical protein
VSVSIRFQGHDYVTLLKERTPLPSTEQVLAALTAAVGQRVQEVGDIDVGSNLPSAVEPDSSDDVVRAAQPAHIIGTLDASEEDYIVVAGLRVVLAPGVSVAEDVLVGAIVGELNGLTVATGVRRTWAGQ